MSFGTWNVSILCRTGSLETASSKLANHNLDLVAVQEVRLVEGGSHPFFYGNGNTCNHLGTGFFVHKGIISAGKI
jgi:hypothetical protein